MKYTSQVILRNIHIIKKKFGEICICMANPFENVVQEREPDCVKWSLNVLHWDDLGLCDLPLNLFQIMEFSVVQKEYTQWCREVSNSFHPQWLRRFSKITQLIYNPMNPVQIFVRDEQMFCIIDKTQVGILGFRILLFGMEMVFQNTPSELRWVGRMY